MKRQMKIKKNYLYDAGLKFNLITKDKYNIKYYTRVWIQDMLTSVLKRNQSELARTTLRFSIGFCVVNKSHQFNVI